ncbi:GNAT family N-acetyltransferase [Candidatus Dependentiae bacterium]|nr:GNAT family N-acetyltransferase [Candidatus Dependentiae bacterium]
MLSNLANAIIANIYFFLTFFAGHCPHRYISFQNNIIIAYSNENNRFLNYVLNAKFNTQNVANKVDKVVNFFKFKNLHNFNWWVFPKNDQPSNLSEILKNKDFKLQETYFNMYLELDKLDLSQIPKNQDSGFIIKGVTTPQMLKIFGQILVDAEFIDLDSNKLLEGFPLKFFNGDESGLEFYIGYLNGKPVSCICLIFHAGVIGYNLLAVLPEYRSHGYGKMMCLHAIKRALNRNFKIACFQVEEKYKQIYEHYGAISLPECNICKYTYQG